MPTDRPNMFRRIPTTRGVYLVQWTRDALLGLLDQEHLTAGDILLEPGPELTRLIRDLFLVGLADELSPRRASDRHATPHPAAQASAESESRLTRLARALLKRRRTQLVRPQGMSQRLEAV